MKKRNICIISQYFLPDVNGDVVRLLNVLRALKRENNVVLITAYPHYPHGKVPKKLRRRFFIRQKWNGVDVIRTFILPLSHKGFINRFLLYSSFSLSSLISIFLVKKPDVVLAFSQKVFSYFTGIAFKIFRGSRLALDLTDIWPEAIVNTGYMKEGNKLFKLIDWMLKIIYKLSDKVIVLTEPMKKIIALKGISLSKIAILPNVIGIKIKSPNNSSDGEKFPGKFIVMYSGNLGPNYDFKTLLRTALLMRNNEDILFIIRGKGEMRNQIINFIRKKDLKNVYLDERILDEDELVNYLNRANVFVLPMKKCPYPNASFPIKLLDYLGIGRPIICCADGFLSNFILTNQIGIAVSPGKFRELANAILTLKNDPELRERMTKQARDTIKKYFSYESFEENVANIFQSL